MSLPSFQRNIGQHQYTVYRLSFQRWRELLGICENLFGKALLSVLADRSRFSDLLDKDVKSLVEAALSIVQKFAAAEGTTLLARLGEHSRVVIDNQVRMLTMDQQELWWAQNPAELLPWLAFALEIQFKDFFYIPASQALAALRAPVVEKVAIT